MLTELNKTGWPKLYPGLSEDVAALSAPDVLVFRLVSTAQTKITAPAHAARRIQRVRFTNSWRTYATSTRKSTPPTVAVKKASAGTKASASSAAKDANGCKGVHSLQGTADAPEICELYAEGVSGDLGFGFHRVFHCASVSVRRRAAAGN
ncbi:hypothetical protein EDD15DRAFT_2196558 [Pisolithus albus]|nr:hypothetical protein EDD15DRAFT_2196558 [Pisolithus albus]